MKKLITIICLIAFLVSCMGTHPRPIETFQYEDNKKSCAELEVEITKMENDVLSKKAQRDTKIGLNMFSVIVGVLLFFPILFLIDAKSDERVEMEALIKRRNILANISADQECSFINGNDYSREVFIAKHDLGGVLDGNYETNTKTDFENQINY
jgi:hypothetical protein